MSPFAHLSLALIRVYKLSLSPYVGRECRYLPTCSSYAADAIRAHGAWAGGWMTAARICRCHPLGGAGWDPAPTEKPGAPAWAPWRYGDWRGGLRTPPEPSDCSLATEEAAERA
jgi:uncharacterized protein